MTSSKHFDRSCLTRVAITVGLIHILGSVCNTFYAVYTLITPDPDFGEIYYNDAIIQISTAPLFAFSGFLLIFGTLKESHLMFLPWLILEGFGLIIYFIYATMNLLDSSLHNWNTFVLTIINFIIIGLCVYVWFAMLSLYQIFREEKINPKHDDEENLCADLNSNQDLDSKPYYSTYVIPVGFSKPNLPPSQIKY